MALLAGVVFFACRDQDPLSPEPVVDPVASIVASPASIIADAAHAAPNPDFFFLPPAVPDPSGDPNFSAGAFDGGQSPSVAICALDASGVACDTSQPSGFPLSYDMTTGPGSETVRLDQPNEHYIVNWHTNAFTLDTATTYRIQVLVAGTMLGYADVDVVSSGKELKNVDTGEFVALKDGRTLPIKFRIEAGAVFVVDEAGGTVTAQDGAVTLDFPADALQGPVGVTVLAASNYPVVPYLVPGTVYDFAPDGITFSQPVSLTINYGDALPSGMDESSLSLQKLVGGVWQMVPGGNLDLAANTVSADIGGFSVYAVASGVVIDITETITVSDAVAVLPPVSIVVTEAITVSDVVAVDAVPIVAIAITETITVSDAVVVIPPVSIAVTETITVSDAVAVDVVPIVAIAITETITVSDAPGVVPVLPVASVDVAPATVTLVSLDEIVQLTATARDQNGNGISGKTFTWSSSDNAIATVTPSGLVTAVTNGAVTIAASTDGIDGVAGVTVDQVVATVTVTPPSVTFDRLRGFVQLTAYALDVGGSVIPGKTFTWMTSDLSVASVNTSGLVTTTGNGAAAITASTDGIDGVAGVTVDQVVATVSVTPWSVTFDWLGGFVALRVYARDVGGSFIPGKTFKWTTSDLSVASVNQLGLVTATGNGAAAITASTDGIDGVAVVTVDQVVATVTVTPPSVTFDRLGEFVALRVYALDVGGSVIPGKTFTWMTSDLSVASVNTSGLVTATGNGAAAITASTDGIDGVAGVTVDQVVATVDVSPATVTLVSLDEMVQLTATARDANGNPISGKTFTWSSSDNSIATVDPSTGLVTATGYGPATITASTDGIDGVAGVTVGKLAATVEVVPVSTTLVSLGETVQLTATALDANGNLIPGMTFEWVSTDKFVATVDSEGLVTAVGNGDAAISAITAGALGSMLVSVAQELAAVEVVPASQTLVAPGETVQLTATAVDAGRSPIVGKTFVWLSSGAAAAVDSDGLVTAVADGEATITATTDGVEGAASITVDQVVDKVVVDPDSPTPISPGETLQLTATAWHAPSGDEILGKTFTWSSSDNSIATVDQSTGLVTARGNGTATITASTDGVDGTSMVNVVP